MLFFYPMAHAARETSFLQPHSISALRAAAQRGTPGADCLPVPENSALKAARNIISMLYLQLRFPIQAPHTIHCRMDHYEHASAVYASWLEKHCADLEGLEQAQISSSESRLQQRLQTQVNSLSTNPICQLVQALSCLQQQLERRQLFGVVKMLLAILWHIRVEDPRLITVVEGSLNKLERLASVCPRACSCSAQRSASSHDQFDMRRVEKSRGGW